MMSKIGIITFHFCKNYGALLQCYALEQFLTENGFEVYVLNARSKKQRNNNSIFMCKKGLRRVIRNIVLLPLLAQRLKQERAFGAFVQDKLNCTELCTNEGELLKCINSYRFDAVVVGSDQVWNTLNNDFEKMFFLPFSCKAKKIGYGISLGDAGYNELVEYKKYIDDFYSIFVRERSSLNIFNKLLNKNLKTVVDPVLLLDKEHWDKMADDVKYDLPSKYLVCYFVGKKNFNIYYQYAKQISKQLGLKLRIINSSYGIYSYSRKTFLNIGPKEFLKIISNASFVCTDSFHGTVVSTIFRKDFCSFVDSNKTNDSRVKDYLCDIGLDSRIIYSERIDLSELHYEELNYTNEIDKRMKEEADEARCSIKDTLETLYRKTELKDGREA